MGVKIYTIGNYLFFEQDSKPTVVDHSKDVKIYPLGGGQYRVESPKIGSEIVDVDATSNNYESIGEVQDETATPYTESSWKTFYTENTGNFNTAGGGSPALIKADNSSLFPFVGETSILYYARDSKKIYTWENDQYEVASPTTIRDDLSVVTNYASLPAASSSVDKFYWVSQSQGVWLLGTRKASGIYYSNGTTWEFIDTPLEATDLDALKRDGSNANSDVDLGVFALNAKSLKVNGTGGNGNIGLKHQSAGITASASESALGADSVGDPVWKNDSNPIQKIIIGDATTQSKVNAIDQSISATEKSTWNAKQDALGYTPLDRNNNLSDLQSAATARTNLGLGTLATQSGTFSGTSSGINNGDETTATIQAKLGAASALSSGYLLQADWNTFNNKQNAIGYTPVNKAGDTFTGAFGYGGAGTGGTVTQLTNKSTAVTLNKICGEITMNAAALAAATIVSFTCNNTTVAATDIVIVNHVTTGTFGAYGINARCTAGVITFSVRNNSAASLSEAIVIRFEVIKSTNA